MKTITDDFAAVLTLNDVTALAAILERVGVDKVRYGFLSDDAKALRSKLDPARLLMGAMCGHFSVIKVTR